MEPKLTKKVGCKKSRAKTDTFSRHLYEVERKHRQNLFLLETTEFCAF